MLETHLKVPGFTVPVVISVFVFPLRTRRNCLFGIRVAVPGLDRMDKTTVQSAVLVTLDIGLDERSAATNLQHIEVTELPAEPASQGFIELPDLAA